MEQLSNEHLVQFIAEQIMDGQYWQKDFSPWRPDKDSLELFTHKNAMPDHYHGNCPPWYDDEKEAKSYTRLMHQLMNLSIA